MAHLDFIDVEPLPDELAHSIIARLAFLNCCDSDTLIAKLARFYGIPKSSSHVSVVAQTLGYRNAEFLKMHTLHPLLYAVDRGTNLVDIVNRRAGFRTFFGPKINTAANYCARCSELDRHVHSMSFWRRAHHLPSVDWCPVHYCGLESYRMLHTEYPTSDSKTVGAPTVYVEGTEHAANPVLRRYSALLMVWREKEVPYRSRDICDLILDACLHQGIGITKGDSQSLLSDALVEALPHSWLVKFMPRLSNKTKGTVDWVLDKYLEQRFAYLTIKMVALLLSYLFDSIETIDSHLNMGSGCVNRDFEKN
ncbi:hypothetical protein F3B38_01300 [Janthinobacterium lividum]|nr:hypothetical protein F3B38_01300 [Janthinobacterium lividum]